MKSVGLAYILWFFLGFAGAHKFYLMRPWSGVLYCVLHGLGWLTSGIIIGFVFWGAWLLLWLLDILFIPGQTRKANQRITGMLQEQFLNP